MEPPAAASPDPAPQDLSPAPSAAKRSVWKHPAPNGLADPPPPGAGVMDANHWPALSETAKGAKLAPAPAPGPGPGPDSSRPPDSSPAPAPAPAPAPVASSPVSNPSNSQKHSSGTHHGRHKPARRGGGTSGGDHSPRDHHPDRHTGGGWDHGGGGRGGQRGHNNSGGGRRGNGSGGSGGGVSHHGGGGGGGGGGFGGRRRGGFDGFYRGPHPMGMGYMRATPPPPPPMAVTAPFMGPPPPPVSPMRGFAGPMLFHEMPSPVSPVSPMYYFTHPPPEALRGMAFAPPMVGPPAYPYFQAPHEPQPAPEAEPEHEPEIYSETKHAELMKQIEFYFSKDNLCGDVYLRQQMDDHGWVDISVIAGFNKVRKLTDDVQYVKEIVQSLPMLEMQGDKVRTRDDWNIWVIPRSSNRDTPSNSASAPGNNVNNLTVHLGGMGLHESASSSSTVDQHHHEVLQNGSPSGNDQAPAAEDNSGQH